MKCITQSVLELILFNWFFFVVVLLTSLFFQFNIGCMLVYIYIYIYKKNPIKSSLDFALIVFWFLVVGQSCTYNLLSIIKAWHTNKMTKHIVDFLYQKNLKWCCLGDGYDCINILIFMLFTGQFLLVHFIFSHIAFYFYYLISFKCDAQKLPSTPSESDRPQYPSPWKNSSQQFLTFVFPFIGHILPFQ